MGRRGDLPTGLVPVCRRHICPFRQRPRRRFQGARRDRLWRLQVCKPALDGHGHADFQFHGTTAFADLLAGYHKQLGPLTIKILGGLTVGDQNVDDPESIAGTEVGAKAVLETWWNVTDRVWTSVDLSWSTVHDIYGARARLGWRLWPALSIGIEGGATGSWDYDTARIGSFVRYEWATGEASLSAGFSGDGPGSGWVDVHGPFATFSVLTRF